MLAAPLHQPWIVTFLSQQNSSYSHAGVWTVFVTQFIILISSRLIVDVCGEKGFWENSAAGTDNKSFEYHYSYYFLCSFFEYALPCNWEPTVGTWFEIKTLAWPIFQSFSANTRAYNLIKYILCTFRHSTAVNMQFYIQFDKHKDVLPSAELLYTSSTRGTSALWVQGRPAGSKSTLWCEQTSW